ncbi:apolipoprotein N-acyltransferase [Thalassococcus sp. CAU 1522]|uniref:Apolipoprotein N-acyltransferase n=2 Tax=Thalassococcus arenae TaxID=2851652 RepID=A0ABS6N7T0_9RHOB|nr:apolipoprotein N-acyltransferase [Thalassococcus arenae]MBV2360070.1 apolipoprotein N-acyltransferase [Thalassococcus arenae]
MGLSTAPYDLWYLGFAGLVAAFWLFAAAPAAFQAIGTGWGVGLGYFGFGLGWIVEPFMVDVAETGWMAPFALLLMAGGLALFWALAFWSAAHLRSRPLWALVLTWTAAELARAYVFTGFPWGLVGYLWAPVMAIQWVSVIGPHGLTLVTLAVAASLAMALRAGRDGAPSVAAGLIGLAALGLGGAWLTPPVQDLSGRPMIRLIQPNAPQHEKWDPNKVQMFFDRQVSFTAAPPEGAKPALVVWPETAVPVLLNRAGDAFARISEAAGPAPVVVGIQRAESGRFYNSLAVMDGQGGLVQVYDKHHLVPFGEYMPAAALFRRWNIFGLAARAEGGYSPGPGPDILDLGGLGLALPLICYEAVFPQDVQRAPLRPDLLLQITNDAWFGSWSGPYQHFAQARIRAIEQGLPMVRAANTGVSAMIDGAGRIVASLPLNQEGFVDAPLPPPMRHTLYARTGDLPVLVLLFACAAGLIALRRRVSD